MFWTSRRVRGVRLDTNRGAWKPLRFCSLRTSWQGFCSGGFRPALIFIPPHCIRQVLPAAPPVRTGSDRCPQTGSVVLSAPSGWTCSPETVSGCSPESAVWSASQLWGEERPCSSDGEPPALSRFEAPGSCDDRRWPEFWTDRNHCTSAASCQRPPVGRREDVSVTTCSGDPPWHMERGPPWRPTFELHNQMKIHLN